MERSNAAGNTAGLRVLVVEDETMAVMLLEDILEEFGCNVVGVEPRVASAKRTAKTAEFDCAILDVNVHGESVYPVARALDERGLPYILVTGYNRADIAACYQDRTILQKPFEPRQLHDALMYVTRRSGVAT